MNSSCVKPHDLGQLATDSTEVKYNYQYFKKDTHILSLILAIPLSPGKKFMSLMRVWGTFCGKQTVALHAPRWTQPWSEWSKKYTWKEKVGMGRYAAKNGHTKGGVSDQWSTTMNNQMCYHRRCTSLDVEWSSMIVWIYLTMWLDVEWSSMIVWIYLTMCSKFVASLMFGSGVIK